MFTLTNRILPQTNRVFFRCRLVFRIAGQHEIIVGNFSPKHLQILNIQQVLLLLPKIRKVMWQYAW